MSAIKKLPKGIYYGYKPNTLGIKSKENLFPRNNFRGNYISKSVNYARYYMQYIINLKLFDVNGIDVTMFELLVLHTGSKMNICSTFSVYMTISVRVP